MESKLGLNMELVNQARQSAAKVADDVQSLSTSTLRSPLSVPSAVCWVSMASTIWTSPCPTWWWIICWQFPCSLQALLGLSAMHGRDRQGSSGCG